MDEAVDILIVEDDPNDVALTLRALRKLNITTHIHVATDGEEALEFLFGHGEIPTIRALPRVILLDLKLPKIDGIEVLRRIRDNAVTRFIPVVMLTASKESRDIIAAYTAGACSYVVKPVVFDKFFDAISQIGTYWLLRNEVP